MTLPKDSNDYIIRTPDLDYTPDPRGLGYVLHACMKKFGNKVAQIDGVTGEKDTYLSLLQKCTRTAIKMRSLGVTSNDIICTCTFNNFNSAVPYLATLFLGAKISALDPTLSLEDTVHLLQQVTPKIIFVDPEAQELIEQAIAQLQEDVQLVIFASSTTHNHESFDKFLQPSIEEELFQPYETDDLFDTAIIFFSSGTSGLPKGICIHHYGILCQIYNYINFGRCSVDVYLSFSSLYWVTSVFGVVTLIIRGFVRIIIPKFNLEDIWNAIDKFKPTAFTAVPFHFVLLCKSKPKNVDTSSLRNVAIGGGALLPSQLSDIKEAFPTAQLFPAYGQTEMCFAITLFNVQSEKHCEFIRNKPTSSGTVLPGIWYKVVDVETQKVLGPNEPGELRIKSKFHMNGYYNMDFSSAFDADGWLRTGDFVYYDDDRCFYVLDRLKDFLRFQNWHVPPAFIENILTQHSEITNAVVIGLPHEIDENHLMAIVVLKTKSQVTPKEIEEFVEKRVDDRKRLRGGVKIVSNIPLAATGKVKRREIRDMVLRGEL